MTDLEKARKGFTEWVDHIPVIWFEPAIENRTRRLIIFLNHFTAVKEASIPYLQDLAAQGYVALSFDAWLHGGRGSETQQELLKRVFGNFGRYMWPILGHTILDTLRVIDWAIDVLKVEASISFGGLSMGGDIAIAAAGIDHRIKKVATVAATPDWLRLGMEDAFYPGILMPEGKPDGYARYFYDHFNPLTHLEFYSHGPEMHFFCGEKDTHVPASGALQFQTSLQKTYPKIASKIQVSLLPNFKHLDILEKKLWWPQCLAWLT